MNQTERRAIMERIYASLMEWGYRTMDALSLFAFPHLPHCSGKLLDIPAMM